MTKPLLLYITDTEALGGAEGYLRTLLLHADRSRFRVGLLLPPRPATQPLVDEARQHGIEVHAFDLVHRQGLSVRGVWRAARVLRRLRPAIVHFNVPSPRRCAEMVLGAAIARVPQRIITFQLVTPIPRFGRIAGTVRDLNRQLQYRTLHHGIAVSQGNARLLLEQYRFPAARLHTIPNGVDTQHWRPLARTGALRERWNVPAHAPLIGLVGRLSRQKGHAVLFAALPEIWAAHPDVHVALLGRGELEDSLREQAAQIDSHERIHFVGQQSDMVQALAELDVFALPSLYEGLSFAVLEAMATERAIVASAVDGTVEALDDERTGLLVPPNDSAALADAIIRLLADPALRRRLGHAARQVAIDCFDQQQMLARTFALYRQEL